MAKGSNKKPRRAAWSEAKARRFLEALTESCNVTFAAETAGLSSSVVYRRRRSDASFRAEWATALSTAYAALEMWLLRRALHGVEKPIDAKDPEAGTMRHYDDRTALALLRMHRDKVEAVDRVVDAQEHEEACERIIEKLRRLRERVTGERVTGDAG
ncbi:hypothetical protein [Sphingomonas sp. LY160]|uniref:hypothetical protein n=1 Tax=Sphingomonas sp. LY160 TaxID=3095342 RepID=UPI002ADEED5F|nr:hypothetical protein [Sphingomonas sp. LY160]MEA1073277.1 hypothetical protein [Sphingomonas sp. LY160]